MIKDVKLLDGSVAIRRYQIDNSEAKRERLQYKKYDKDPLSNPAYIKQAKENPQSEYQKHMYVTKLQTQTLTKEEQDHKNLIDMMTTKYVRNE